MTEEEELAFLAYQEVYMWWYLWKISFPLACLYACKWHTPEDRARIESELRVEFEAKGVPWF